MIQTNTSKIQIYIKKYKIYDTNQEFVSYKSTYVTYNSNKVYIFIIFTYVCFMMYHFQDEFPKTYKI